MNNQKTPATSKAITFGPLKFAASMAGIAVVASAAGWVTGKAIGAILNR